MSRNLRIIHCLRAPIGGLFRHVVDLAVEQAGVGHEVGVIYDSNTANAAGEEKMALLRKVCRLGLRTSAMPRLMGPKDLTAYKDVKRFAHDKDAQILHGHGAKGGAYARLAASSLRAKGLRCLAFYTPHGGSLHYSPKALSGRVFLGLERQLARKTSGLIFESAFSARIYERVVGQGVCPSRVIPNGLTQFEFRPVTKRPDAAEFVFIGELRLLKGVDLLLEAISALKSRMPNVRLAIVGDGPDMAKFQKQSLKLGLSQNVTFYGRLPARQGFELGHCLVIPSRAESFPYIILEAGAAGMPLITTNVGGISEITAGSGMALIPPENAPVLMAAMDDFLTSPQKYSDLALELQQIVQQKFSVERMASEITDFYLSVLKP